MKLNENGDDSGESIMRITVEIFDQRGETDYDVGDYSYIMD